MSGVAFVDTETTGLDSDRCPIWEIAVIVPDGPNEGEHVWTQRLPLLPPGTVTKFEDRVWRPPGDPAAGWMPLVADDAAPRSSSHITRWVVENTGITERYDHRRALSPFASIERFADLVDGRHLVGAVPSFDEERLRRLYRQYVDEHATRLPWHYHLIDVEALAVGYLAGLAEFQGYDAFAGLPSLPWSSDDLSRALGVEPPAAEKRHSALTDARWARRIYENIIGGAA